MRVNKTFLTRIYREIFATERAIESARTKMNLPYDSTSEVEAQSEYLRDALQLELEEAHLAALNLLLDTYVEGLSDD